MRFMVIVKATGDSEAGKLPSAELLTAMGKSDEELVNAGVLLMEDFGEVATPELLAQEEALRARL